MFSILKEIIPKLIGHSSKTKLIKLGTQEATHAQTQVPQGYYGYQQPENQLPQRASISTSETTEEEDDDDNEDEEVIEAPTAGFDYFGNVGSQVMKSVIFLKVQELYDH